MAREPHPGRLLTIAHRAGNELPALHRATAAGVHLVEADVWRYRGRLEVRHTKTLGPLPVLWDRWLLAPGWTPRFELAELLAVAGPSVELMLDLKGTDPGLPRAVLEARERVSPDRPLTVCSRSWRLLTPFRDVAGMRVVYSAGDRAQLCALHRVLAGPGPHAVSVDQRLLTRELVGALRRRADLLLTWTVNTTERLEELLAWGVNGITSDSLDLLQSLREKRAW
jgi:glycerophosphoryl diester phosphodiesterase